MCKLALRGKTPSKGQGHEGHEGQQIIFVLKIYQIIHYNMENRQKALKYIETQK